MSQTILPGNNSPLLHALSRLTAEETATIDWRVITDSKNPTICAAAWLPWLAWQNSISDAEGWRFAETEQAQRNLIAGYIEKHQIKGTPAVIRRLFRDLQLGEVEILERVTEKTWDGSFNFDGSHLFGGAPGDWAKYAIVLKRVVSIEQVEIIKQLLAEIAPARCQLLYLEYRSNPLYWDGEITFNGNYTFGAITSG